MNLKSLVPTGSRELARGGSPTSLMSLQREIDRIFDDFTRGFPAFSGREREMMPKMDVVETDKDIEVTAELPGLDTKDVEINVADNVLTIRGEKQAEKEEKNKNYQLVERSYGSFYRALELPPGFDPSSVKASMSKGVLKVTVPKPAPSQVKKVEVKAAA